MSPFAKLVILILLAEFSQNVDAYMRGAPPEACTDMEPQHGPAPQTSPAPYTITPQQNAIEQGGTVKVTIQGKSPKGGFMGFLFMAVNPEDSSSKPLGRFINSPYQARSVDCLPGEQNALTHRDAKSKNNLELTWQAPPDYQGEIEFRCTFLRDFSTFWLRVPASTLVRVGNPVVARAAETSSGVSLVPMVTVFDYFVWRIWFWTPEAQPQP
ncbi:putative defense protein 3 [Daphnia pulicaria]|uniref:putative defense protein 3 n=1 Tax=Daphnia pulicaria TaxID=35523 RepID=UPI001EE9E469|nr:putative defense protein 3 [Daphnia pulicaria]